MSARRSAGRPNDPRRRPSVPTRSRKPAEEIVTGMPDVVGEPDGHLSKASVQPSGRPVGPWWPGYAIATGVVAVVLIVFMTVIALASDVAPVSPRDIYVIDGDTIRVSGETYRLVGFDAPEIGRTARCEREVEKGFEAKAALVDLVHSGKPLTLQRVACSCPPSAAEGSQACNYGRWCGTLRVGGEDVGAILIRAGLAKDYPYRWDRVPPKPEWCGRAGTR